MRIIFVALLVPCILGAPTENEVFRYSLDEEAKQEEDYHYMAGEPGKDVSGGWSFKAPEGGVYAMSYRANEAGFQPEAEYLPVPVAYTQEVADARQQFLAAYDDYIQLVEEAAVEYSAQEATVADNDDMEVVERQARSLPVYPYYSTVYPQYYYNFYPYPVHHPTYYYQPYVRQYKPLNKVPNTPDTLQSGVEAV